MYNKVLHNIITETIRNTLNEYHEQYRIPFKEYGEGHAFIDEFIDWIQYSSKKGTLPKPKITFEEGIKKGLEEYAKKTGKDVSDVEEDFYNEFEQDALTFDKNGNLYVERAIKVKPSDFSQGINSREEDLYQQLIKAYEKNVGGCWAYKKGMGNAYCGYGGIEIVFKGYMFLDDVFWTEFIRLELRGINEKEIRTYPNGRVQLMEIVVNGKTLTTKTFDGPRILNSTYFGNNEKYDKTGFAKLGYERIGYDNQYIDREGNEYKLTDYVQKSLQNGVKPEDLFDEVGEYSDGFAPVELNDMFNYIDKNGNLLSPKQWFDECEYFRYNGFAKVDLNGKSNFIDKTGNLLSPNQWFDYLDDFYKGFATVKLNGKWNFIDTNGNLLSPNQWFDETFGLYDGFASVRVNNKWNFIDTNGNLLSPNQWFDKCLFFVDGGFSQVYFNGRWKVIDSKGNLHDEIPNMNQVGESFSRRKTLFNESTFKNILKRIVKEEMARFH